MSLSAQSSLVLPKCLDNILLHGYVIGIHTVAYYSMCVCVQLCTQAYMRTFSATLSHSGIVNSLLSKLLNGVTTRAKAFSFFAFSLHPLTTQAARSQVVVSAIGLLFFITEVVSGDLLF